MHSGTVKYQINFHKTAQNRFELSLHNMRIRYITSECKGGGIIKISSNLPKLSTYHENKSGTF